VFRKGIFEFVLRIDPLPHMIVACAAVEKAMDPFKCLVTGYWPKNLSVDLWPVKYISIPSLSLVMRRNMRCGGRGIELRIFQRSFWGMLASSASGQPQETCGFLRQGLWKHLHREGDSSGWRRRCSGQRQVMVLGRCWWTDSTNILRNWRRRSTRRFRRRFILLPRDTMARRVRGFGGRVPTLPRARDGR